MKGGSEMNSFFLILMGFFIVSANIIGFIFYKKAMLINNVDF